MVLLIKFGKKEHLEQLKMGLCILALLNCSKKIRQIFGETKWKENTILIHQSPS